MADCTKKLKDNCYSNLKNINFHYICKDYIHKINEYNITIISKYKDYTKNQIENEFLKLLNIIIVVECKAIKTCWVLLITKKKKDSIAMYWILKE